MLGLRPPECILSWYATTFGDGYFGVKVDRVERVPPAKSAEAPWQQRGLEQCVDKAESLTCSPAYTDKDRPST